VTAAIRFEYVQSPRLAFPSTSITARSVSGFRSATSVAITPPSECPMSTALSSRAPSHAASSSAVCSIVRDAADQGDRPYPGRSTSTWRYGHRCG
jgi:hypothetical protein